LTRLIRVNAITFLNYFVSGALTLIIPLLLLAHHVNIAVIGIVLSIYPLVFLVTRLLFSAIADYVGWSHVFLLINWPSTVLSTIIYYIATSLPFFVLGKLVEAMREASYWAVARTAVYHLRPQRAGHEATRINGVIWIGMAAGAGAAGLGIDYLGFSSSLLMLTAVSLAIGVPAVMLWRSSKTAHMPKSQQLFAPLNPKGRPRRFWAASFAIMFNSLAIYPLTNLLLPIFMSQNLGYSYITIGVLFMVYNAISALVTWLTAERALNFQRAAVLTGISVVASVFLASSGQLFPAFLFALAFVRGYGVGFFEHTVVKVAKDSKNLSVDIGWLHVPMRLAEFSSLVVGGVIAQVLGYTPVFIATGIFFGIFAFLCLRVIRSPPALTA
jgi:predicted MFS family arabinose efflux permease